MQNTIPVIIVFLFAFFCNPAVVFAAGENKRIASDLFKTNFEQYTQFISKFDLKYTLTPCENSACVLKLGKITPSLNIKFKPLLKKDAESVRSYDLEKKISNGYLKDALNYLMKAYTREVVKALNDQYPSMRFPVSCSIVDRDVATQFKEYAKRYRSAQDEVVKHTTDRITEIQNEMSR